MELWDSFGHLPTARVSSGNAGRVNCSLCCLASIHHAAFPGVESRKMVYYECVSVCFCLTRPQRSHVVPRMINVGVP